MSRAGAAPHSLSVVEGKLSTADLANTDSISTVSAVYANTGFVIRSLPAGRLDIFPTGQTIKRSEFYFLSYVCTNEAFKVALDVPHGFQMLNDIRVSVSIQAEIDTANRLLHIAELRGVFGITH